MKVLAISGGFKNGTNDAMAKEALMGAREMEAELEFIHMLDLDLKVCTGCLTCVTRPSGIVNGGPANCIQKDDFLWLTDKIYDADGIIFVMPVFEKMAPGFFKAFEDRFGGPSRDVALLTVAQRVHDAKGLSTPGPDPRAFQRRFATYIGIGGSDWTTWMSANFNMFGNAPMFKVVDDLTFSWGKSIIMDDERVERIREAGRAIARTCADPESYKYLGDAGICSNCHSRVLYVHDDDQTVECAVCGVKGRVVAADDKIVFEYPADQLDHAHNLMPGKIKHADGIAEHEREFHEVTQTDEYKRRMYRDFIKGLKPAH